MQSVSSWKVCLAKADLHLLESSFGQDELKRILMVLILLVAETPTGKVEHEFGDLFRVTATCSVLSKRVTIEQVVVLAAARP
jgi:hypothetical protein